MAHNLTCGCRLNRPRTLSLSQSSEYIDVEVVAAFVSQASLQLAATRLTARALLERFS